MMKINLQFLKGPLFMTIPRSMILPLLIKFSLRLFRGLPVKNVSVTPYDIRILINTPRTSRGDTGSIGRGSIIPSDEVPSDIQPAAPTSLNFSMVLFYLALCLLPMFALSANIFKMLIDSLT